VFFVASKVFWMFLAPIVVLLVLALMGASWSGDRWRRAFCSIGVAAIPHPHDRRDDATRTNGRCALGEPLPVWICLED
jgi:uncharacterized membrane protein